MRLHRITRSPAEATTPPRPPSPNPQSAPHYSVDKEIRAAPRRSVSPSYRNAEYGAARPRTSTTSDRPRRAWASVSFARPTLHGQALSQDRTASAQRPELAFAWAVHPLSPLLCQPAARPKRVEAYRRYTVRRVRGHSCRTASTNRTELKHPHATAGASGTGSKHLTGYPASSTEEIAGVCPFRCHGTFLPLYVRNCTRCD